MNYKFTWNEEKTIFLKKQEILILKKENYTYYVPFLQNNDEIILKTIVPSRKYNKKYGEKNVNKL